MSQGKPMISYCLIWLVHNQQVWLDTSVFERKLQVLKQSLSTLWSHQVNWVLMYFLVYISRINI